MSKISIIGVGTVGSNLVYSLVPNPKIDKINLIDINKKKLEGISLDISHAYPEFSHKLKITDYEDTYGSKIIVVTAGVPRTSKPMTRMDLLEVNKKIMKGVIHSIKFSSDSILIILTNPVESLTYIAYKISGLEWNRVIGFGNILDSERLRFILSKNTNIPPEKIFSLVIGEHGEDMIPVFSQCFLDGKSLTAFNLDTSEILMELKSTAKRIIDSTGATRYGPVTHLVSLINSILDDNNKMFPVSFFIEESDFYEVDNVCITLPAKVSINGIGEIERINLNEDEKNKLKKLAEKLKKIQSELI